MNTEWKNRHQRAVDNPMGTLEHALVSIYDGLRLYASWYHKEYGQPIGDDNHLGPAWATVARGFGLLLDGEVGGRLDRSELSHVIHAIATANEVADQL